MELLVDNYGYSSGDEEAPLAEGAMEEEKRQQSILGSASNELGDLPADLIAMFNDSEYDLNMERRRADERAKGSQWTRRFPHERGNWPTFVFIAVPNSGEFVSMARASVLDFREKLTAAWVEQHGPVGGRSKKRGRNGQPSPKHKQKGNDTRRHKCPPEVVINDMTPTGHQHLSISKTVVLRAHQIDPFVQALRETFGSSRRFTASVVSGYDILVNEDKSRSFVCLRVRGGRHLVRQLIKKTDIVMERFKQPVYYEDPVVHVSIASVAGDVSSYVGASSDESRGTSFVGVGEGARGSNETRGKCDAGGDGSSSSSESEKDDTAPSEICIDVDMVVCKAGTSLFQAPFLTHG